MKIIVTIFIIILLFVGCATMPQYKGTDKETEISIIEIGETVIAGCVVYYFGKEMEWY